MNNTLTVLVGDVGNQGNRTIFDKLGKANLNH